MGATICRSALRQAWHSEPRELRGRDTFARRVRSAKKLWRRPTSAQTRGRLVQVQSEAAVVSDAREPQPLAAGAVRWVGVAVAYALLALLVTWPLVTRLATHLPLGALHEPTVPYFNLWTMEWNALRLAHGYAGYWDAPIFHPARDAFAMSEPQGLTGWLFSPLCWLLGPVPAYDLSLLALLWLNGWAGRRLLRLLGLQPLAADLGGALFLGLPLVRHELGVLQLCAAWPVLFALGELAILAREASAAAVVRLGMWLVAAAWSCVYYVLFLGLFVLLAPLFYLRRELLAPHLLRATGLALCVVMAAMAPLLAAERRAVSTHTRSEAAVRSGSGSVLAYLEPPRGTPLARLFPRWERGEGRRSLYPGYVCCALAVLGVVRARRVPPARFVRFALALGVVALLLSFGTRWQLAGVSPYALTVERYVPGFGQLRSPYRAALFVQLTLTTFAGLGLQALARRARGPLLAALCVLLALAEVSTPGTVLARFPAEVLREPWIAWLARQPAGAVAMLPVTARGQAAAYVDTTLGMLQALRHGHPIVNGYSGFFPERTDRLMDRLRHFPGADGVSALREVGVRYVVVDRRWPGARALEPAPEGLEPAFVAEPRAVYRVR